MSDQRQQEHADDHRRDEEQGHACGPNPDERARRQTQQDDPHDNRNRAAGLECPSLYQRFECQGLHHEYRKGPMSGNRYTVGKLGGREADDHRFAAEQFRIERTAQHVHVRDAGYRLRIDSEIEVEAVEAGVGQTGQGEREARDASVVKHLGQAVAPQRTVGLAGNVDRAEHRM